VGWERPCTDCGDTEDAAEPARALRRAKGATREENCGDRLDVQRRAIAQRVNTATGARSSAAKLTSVVPSSLAISKYGTPTIMPS